MKIGLCFPYSQDDLSRELMLEWFRRVDEGPFSALSCGERLIGPCVDMMATLAAAAAVTTRVEIVPTLYVLPMHPAIKVAKHAATLDLISGGRTTITVGIGGRVQDYRCMEKEPVRIGEVLPGHSIRWQEPAPVDADLVGVFGWRYSYFSKSWCS